MIKISINDVLLWSGTTQEIQVNFKTHKKNKLEIQFSGVEGEIRLDKIYFNRLSLESFIYQGTYTTSDGKKLCPCTHIQQDGLWVYEFGNDLAKEIIRTNT